MFIIRGWVTLDKSGNFAVPQIPHVCVPAYIYKLFRMDNI